MTKINTKIRESMKIMSKILRTLDFMYYDTRMTTAFCNPEDLSIPTVSEFGASLVTVRDFRFLGFMCD